MFKKLRYRLLTMNLVIMTLLMFFSLTTVYMLTYNKTYSDIDVEIQRIALISQQSSTPPPLQITTMLKSMVPLFPMPDRNMAFGIDLSADGKMKFVQSFFEEDDAFYHSAIEQVDNSQRLKGQIKLDDSIWAFSKITMPKGYRIVFLDVTSRVTVLHKLLITFITSFFVALAVIYLISTYLTHNSLKPIIEAFDKQKQFISDASHELKTPLSVISSNIDVLLSHGENITQQDQKWLNYIKSETQRMSRLTNDLLYLTQIESPLNTSQDTQIFDFSNLVEQIILAHEAVAYEKQLNLHFKIEKQITISGYAEKINQVIMILLDNALKYTPVDGVIILSLTRSNNYVSLTLANSGPSIPAHLTERIFDRFFRLDDSRSRETESYGLGLSIARAIIEQHGGIISCESIPDEMTTFTVRLKITG